MLLYGSSEGDQRSGNQSINVEELEIPSSDGVHEACTRVNASEALGEAGEV